MKNPKTTIPGLLILVSAAATAVSQYMSHGTMDLGAVVTALSGLGLVAAQDGNRNG